MLYVFRSGAIGITSIWDRMLGRLSGYLRMSFIDGINDHSSSEYIRHFKQLVINSKVSLVDKAKSVVKDVAKKVFLLFRATLRHKSGPVRTIGRFQFRWA